jgi:hypothetical protein
MTVLARNGDPRSWGIAPLFGPRMAVRRRSRRTPDTSPDSRLCVAPGPSGALLGSALPRGSSSGQSTGSPDRGCGAQFGIVAPASRSLGHAERGSDSAGLLFRARISIQGVRSHHLRSGVFQVSRTGGGCAGYRGPTCMAAWSGVPRTAAKRGPQFTKPRTPPDRRRHLQHAGRCWLVSVAG